MGANVYANGMEVSGKASPHNVIASMPDVCLSPPSPPAGPIPIPYPNFAQSSDTTDGSKSVQAGGKEITLKGQSSYKKSMGDEAATKSFGAGVVSHNITGPVKHQAGSFDVKVEGSSVVRTLDLTTGNHINGTNGSMAPDGAGVAPPNPLTDCGKLDIQNAETRGALMSNTRDKTIVGHDSGGAGTTVSSMIARPKGGGRASMTTAHNNHKAVEKCPTPLAEGASDKARAGKESPLCSKSDYKHPDPAIQKSGHAEARLFGELGNARPKTITISIDWQPKTDDGSKMPCEDCHKMLCAAMEDCGHNISLCDSQGNKQNLKDHCPANKTTYQGLQRAMGEGDAAKP